MLESIKSVVGALGWKFVSDRGWSATKDFETLNGIQTAKMRFIGEDGCIVLCAEYEDDGRNILGECIKVMRVTENMKVNLAVLSKAAQEFDNEVNALIDGTPSRSMFLNQKLAA